MHSSVYSLLSIDDNIYSVQYHCLATCRMPILLTPPDDELGIDIPVYFITLEGYFNFYKLFNVLAHLPEGFLPYSLLDYVLSISLCHCYYPCKLCLSYRLCLFLNLRLPGINLFLSTLFLFLQLKTILF